MREIEINLNSIEKVKEFVNLATYHVVGDVDLISGKYTVDGKSIMGIFSLDLSKTITMCVADNVDVSALEKFFV